MNPTQQPCVFGEIDPSCRGETRYNPKLGFSVCAGHALEVFQTVKR